jgi:hypothetical protein
MGGPEGSKGVAVWGGAKWASAKGLYALGILSHEASTIATKERAEMKTN